MSNPFEFGENQPLHYHDHNEHLHLKNNIWTPLQYSKHLNKSSKELTTDVPKQYGLGCQQGACSLTLLKKTESMFILEKGGNLRILSLENVNLL